MHALIFIQCFIDTFFVADVDECASESHQCNPTQICINTEGGYTCSCTEGYWLLEGQCLGMFFCSADMYSLEWFRKTTIHLMYPACFRLCVFCLPEFFYDHECQIVAMGLMHLD